MARDPVGPRLFPLLVLSGKLPARGPDVVRVSENLRTPGRYNPAAMDSLKSALWILFALAGMFLLVAATLLFALYLLR